MEFVFLCDIFRHAPPILVANDLRFDHSSVGLGIGNYRSFGPEVYHEQLSCYCKFGQI